MSIKTINCMGIEFILPIGYQKFLQSIQDKEYFEIENTGICLYKTQELIERNETYEIQKYAVDSLLIGQDGDLGFFIKKETGDDIFSIDLGAVGSLEMVKEANHIDEFIKIMEKEYHTR